MEASISRERLGVRATFDSALTDDQQASLEAYPWSKPPITSVRVASTSMGVAVAESSGVDTAVEEVKSALSGLGISASEK